jgi:hypothetical protein
MRLEGHHAGRQSTLTRRLSETGEHGAVADMHAIEISDGERDR